MAKPESELLQKAVFAMQNGQLPLAFELCRSILQSHPQSAATYNLLGKIAFQSSDQAHAEQFLRKAVELSPRSPDLISDLADFYRLANRYSEASELCEAALNLSPTHLNALNILAAVLIDSGKPSAAIAPLRRALSLSPNHTVLLLNLVRGLMESDQHENAIEPLRKLIQIAPEIAETRPRLLESLVRAHRIKDAEAFYPQVVAAAPNPAIGWATVGHILNRTGLLTTAIQAYEQALMLNPLDVHSRASLFACYSTTGELKSAEKTLRDGLLLLPDESVFSINLASLLVMMGRSDESMLIYHQIAETLKVKPAAHSNYLMHSQYIAEVTPEHLLNIHRQWDLYHGQPNQKHIRQHLNVPDPERRIRIGFVSSDLESGPVTTLTYRCISELDPELFDIFLYAGQQVSDERTERYKLLGHWRVIGDMDDQRLADAIRAEQIDILIDLSGHVANNRLTMFSHRPAPIQITWLGYEGTTGLSTMDYLIADKHMIQPGEEKYYVENILRIEEGYLCYQPQVEDCPVAPLPVLTNGYVRFASFSNPAKYHHGLLSSWGKILKSVPGSRLLLKYRGLHVPEIQESIRARFSEAGGDQEVLDFAGWSSIQELFEAYQLVDIALDTYPFTGSATTCDAMWMGVPVITLKGKTFAGRHGYSHLKRLGLDDLIAQTITDYETIAVNLAKDVDRLRLIHEQLRKLMLERLCDGRKWASSFSQQIRLVWRKWCENQKQHT